MQAEIIPAIIPQSLRDLRTQLASVTFAASIQIDVVDGVFARPASWPYTGDVPHFDLTEPIEGVQIGIDLMVRDPLTASRQWLSIGADRLVVHVESLTKSVWEDIKALKADYTFSLALAINNDTTLDYIHNHMSEIDFVQLMGIATIGSQGQSFDERVLERITVLRKAHPNLPISIDGSVNRTTIRRLYEAGANRFVVGSAIMQAANPQSSYQELQKMLVD